MKLHKQHSPERREFLKKGLATMGVVAAAPIRDSSGSLHTEPMPAMIGNRFSMH